MLNYVVFIFLLTLPPVVLSGHPGWFASIRGGQLSPHPSSIIYPRALSNIAYSYGHIKDTEKEGKEEVVVNVKSTSTKKKWADNDYEEEDHFFHSLYHNNDDKVVTNVSTKKESEDVDLEDVVMFKRLNDKIFHRRHGGEEKMEGKDKREIVDVKYGLEEVFDDVSFFE
ncbi:heat shock factor family protein [Skeletonema marinoi]|uniref:Heat shock factor family protein n=1 Tax=Skeletonema marinoi TaxID=267567 RepID=A0AAD8XZE5_9STRA|nr:heat shock factor family protein [Skeletonema marinoi]